MIALVKAFHLIIVLLLIGNVSALLLLSFKHDSSWHVFRPRLLRSVLWLFLLTMISGTLLVYPRHYTFHTHWIIAAYLLVIFCGALLHYLYRLYHRKAHINNMTMTLSQLWLQRTILLTSCFCLLVVIHDAVVKHTFF